MNAREWLRQQRTSQNSRRRQLFLEAADDLFLQVADGIADSLTGAACVPDEDPPRCPCAVIYSRCHYPAHAQMGT